MTTEIATIEQANEIILQQENQYLFEPALFESMQRAAKLFSASTMLPDHFKNNLANCFIAMQLAISLKMPPFTLMQKMYMVHGKIALQAEVVVGLIHTRGPYVSALKYNFTGQGDSLACTCSGERKNGDIDTCTVSIAMAKKAGWWDKKDSLWPKMPEQMLKYRSATWLARAHCPEILFGMQTVEEVSDVAQPTVMQTASLDELNQSIQVSVVETGKEAVSEEVNPFDYEKGQ